MSGDALFWMIFTIVFLVGDVLAIYALVKAAQRRSQAKGRPREQQKDSQNK